MHEPTTAPSFGVAATVPAAAVYRMIFGTVIHPSGVSQSEFIVILKPAGGGAGQTVLDDQPPVSSTVADVQPFYVLIPGGSTYWLNQSGGVTFEVFSYVDSYPDCASLPCESGAHANTTWEGQSHANATWEGQAHANASWCPYSCVTTSESYTNGSFVSDPYANATFEGRTHANNTWESQVHANASWCPVPACAMNGDQLVSKSYADGAYEGQPHANQTWESQAHANATWCPMTGCTFTGMISAPQLTVGNGITMSVAGNVNSVTAWDPYVGMIVFGALTLAAILAGVWGLRQNALAAKVALVAFLTIAAIWSANQSGVTSNANAFRWVAVVIMSGLALLLAATAKPAKG